MEKEIIRANLELELRELIRLNQNVFERTGNTYYQGKLEAYIVVLNMIIEEII